MARGARCRRQVTLPETVRGGVLQPSSCLVGSGYHWYGYGKAVRNHGVDDITISLIDDSSSSFSPHLRNTREPE